MHTSVQMREMIESSSLVPLCTLKAFWFLDLKATVEHIYCAI